MRTDEAGHERPVPGATVHRDTARVLPVDGEGRVLLLHGWDPAKPAQPFWFTIGGAAETGEDLADAAVRELLEETGIRVGKSDLHGPFASRQHQFDWGEWTLVQSETYFAVRVSSADLTFDGMEQLELETTDRADWWRPTDLEADGTAVTPWLTSLMREAITMVADHGG